MTNLPNFVPFNDELYEGHSKLAVKELENYISSDRRIFNIYCEQNYCHKTLNLPWVNMCKYISGGILHLNGWQITGDTNTKHDSHRRYLISIVLLDKTNN